MFWHAFFLLYFDLWRSSASRSRALRPPLLFLFLILPPRIFLLFLFLLSGSVFIYRVVFIIPFYFDLLS